MSKKLKAGFSLVEILAAVIILAILSALSLAAYQKTLEANDERICQQNQKVLQAAVDIYTLENNSLPLTLSQITGQQIHLACLKVVGQPEENKLRVLVKNTWGIKPALAQTLPALGKYYNYDTRILKCPADKSASSVSYSLNVTGLDTDGNGTVTMTELHSSANSNIALLYDTSAYHKKPFTNESYQIAITPSQTYGKQTIINGTAVPSSTITIPHPNDSNPTTDVASP